MTSPGPNSYSSSMNLVKDHPPPRDLTGAVFSRLTVRGWLGRDLDGGPHNRKHYRSCLCTCGNETRASHSSLLRGSTRSCGCLRRECFTRGDALSKWTGCGDLSGSHWYAIQKDAKRRGIPFEVSIAHAWKLFLGQRRRCALTGVKLTMTGDRRRGTASLDRIDSAFGYVCGNLQWLHKDVNIMKHTHSTAEFVRWCVLVARHVGEADE